MFRLLLEIFNRQAGSSGSRFTAIGNIWDHLPCVVSQSRCLQGLERKLSGLLLRDSDIDGLDE
jgi:hypothetical protein